MNNNIHIDKNTLQMLTHLAKTPKRVLTIDRLNKELKTSYATAYRRVDSLVRQNLIKKSKYGAASQLKINLSKKTILILSLAETERLESFKKSIKASTRLILEQLARTEARSTMIFGSYAKGGALPDSDMDILVIAESNSKRIRDTIRNIRLRTQIKINPIIIDPAEHMEMIMNNEDNVGKETLENHIIISGECEYWGDIARCYPEEK